jgi:hypothetical protein
MISPVTAKRRRALKTLLRKVGVMLLVVLVVVLGAFGVPLLVFVRGHQRPSLRNEYVATEVMRRQAA